MTTENDARRIEPGTRTVEYGLMLDDYGSVDVYDSYEEAEQAFRAGEGIGLMRIETTVMAFAVEHRHAFPSGGAA